MKYFYDTEFHEDGETIDFISIGIIAEDGREYYAVSLDADWGRIKKHEWLMGNVVPLLPDLSQPEWKTKERIRDEVSDFLLDGSDVELWADYCAYDHVVLAQLFGTMMDLPSHIPMYTNDLRSLIAWSGADVGELIQTGGVHNALADAKHLKWVHEHITGPAVDAA